MKILYSSFIRLCNDKLFASYLLTNYKTHHVFFISFFSDYIWFWLSGYFLISEWNINHLLFIGWCQKYFFLFYLMLFFFQNWYTQFITYTNVHTHISKKKKNLVMSHSLFSRQKCTALNIFILFFTITWKKNANSS